MPLVLDGTTGFNLPLGAEIGVGTNAPAGNGLHVDHTAGATLRLTRLGTSTSHFVQLETDGAHGTLRSEGNFTLQSGGANPRITVLSTGNVGIGNTSPGQLLEVTGSGATIRVESTDNNQQGIEFYQNNTKNASIMWGQGSANLEIKNFRNDQHASNLYANIDFFTGGSNATSSGSPAYTPDLVMRLTDDGNVGIGTNNPGQKLTVAGAVESQNGQGSVAFYSTVAGSYNQQNGSGGTAWAYGSTGGSSSPATSASTTFGLHHWNGSAWSNPFNISTSGNVGIGETSPLGKLHVKTADSGATADASADELVIEGSANAGISILSGASNTGSIYFGDSGTNWDGYIAYSQSARKMTFGVAAGGGTVNIDSSGNVGIGTTNPQSPLEVSNGSERYRVAFGTGEVYLMARNASSYIEAEYIATQHEFRGFGDDSGNLAWKINTSGHLIPGANDARNIGESGTAVSNMYMAGGIHFTNGGHGNAHAVHSGGSNYLDAYERGTFTFTLIGDSNPVTTNIAAANTTLYGTGYYEKIGNLCYVSCAYDLTNYNNYIFYHFGNIPFTSYNNSNMYYPVSCGHLRGILFGYGSSTRTDFTFNASVPSNSTQIDLRTTDTTTPFSGYFRVHNINGGKYIRASGVYPTA